MKKFVFSTLTAMIMLSMLVLKGHERYVAFTQKTNITINTEKFSLISRISQRLDESTNKQKKISNKIVSLPVHEELSLKQPIKLTSVVETTVKQSQWEKLFIDLKSEKESFKVNLANVNKKMDQDKAKLTDRISTSLSATKTDVVILKDEKSKSSLNVISNISNKKNIEKTKKKSSYAVGDSKLVRKKIPTKLMNTHSSSKNVTARRTVYDGVAVLKIEHSFDTFKSGFSEFKNDCQLIFSDTPNMNPIDCHKEKALVFEETLSSPMSIRRAHITSEAHYPMAYDIVYKETDSPVEIDIPLINREAFEKALAYNKIQDIGGHILVRLDQLTEDVELDSSHKYVSKIHLNERFKVVNKEEDDYLYTMFIGVDAGNVLVHFRTMDNQLVSKIIHVMEEQFYFEPNLYEEVVSDEYSIYENNILSSMDTPLDITKEEISNFSNERPVEVIGKNHIKMKWSLYPGGTRKYQSFTHQIPYRNTSIENMIFMGRWNQDKVVLPSLEFKSYLLDEIFNISDIADSCIVQANLDKKVKNLSINGLIGRTSMHTQTAILDNDGKFYSNLSLNSEKIFILGEKQGVMNIHVEYVDNTHEFLQTFCSEGSYLVEQL